MDIKPKNDNYSTEPMEMSPISHRPSGDEALGTGREIKQIKDEKVRAHDDALVFRPRQLTQRAKAAAAAAPAADAPNDRIAELEAKVKELEQRVTDTEKVALDEHEGMIEILGKLSESERDRFLAGQRLLDERKEAARKIAELEETKNNEIREWIKKYEAAIANPNQDCEQSARAEAQYFRGQLEQCQTDFNILKERAEWADARADRMKRERDECLRSNARVKAKYENLGKDFDELRRVNGVLATTRVHKLHEKLREAKERIRVLENMTCSSNFSNRECRTPEMITVSSNSVTPTASPIYDSYATDEDAARIGTRSPGPTNARPAYSSASVNAYSYYDSFKS